MFAQNPFLAPPKGIPPFHSEPGTSNGKMPPTPSPPIPHSKGKSMAKATSTTTSPIGEESGIERRKLCQKRSQGHFGTVQREIMPNEAEALWKRRPRRRQMPPRGKFNDGTIFFLFTSKFAPIFGFLLLLMAHFAEGNALDGTMAALNGTPGEDDIERLLTSSSSQFPAKNDLKNGNNGPSEGPSPSLQNKSAINELDNFARELAAAEEAEEEIEANNGTTRNGGIGGHDGQGGQRHFQLVSLNWAHVQAPFSLSLWLLLASIAKILFNLDRRLPEAVPDSALLIGLGLILGAVLNLLGVDSSLFTLPSSTFFLYLLPPIIFDAGYFMPNRQLFENLDSVLLFAFCGTIWNTLAIGFSFLWLAQLCPFPVPFSAFQILLFASLISAVDPVAVIAVFEEIHINEFLFINVFGEALLNDGVSVVLYQMFRKFIQIGEQNLLPLDYVAGIGSFLVIALGGVLIGLLFAVMASLATKFTTRVRILAPVFIFVIPYMAYLSAELFGLSSILAIVACGIGMKQYVKGNLSHDACSSVKYFVKMLAQSSETVIFMFLGLSTMTHAHHWDWLFVGATIAFCLLHRVIGVVVQCAILNRFRTKKFSFSDQFVLSYGGLRGAIAFGLVVSLDDDLPVKNLFVTTCIAVIFFTVFVQGITIRPLLYWLKVEKQDIDHEEKMIEKIYTRYCDYMMAGLEDIAGQKGKNSVRDGFERFNAKILKPVLMRDEQRRTFDTSSIVRAYRKITLIEAHQLARASIRKVKKRSKGGRRVGPAHSPSSFSSTLNSSNCWTTSTTIIMKGAQSNNEEGGLEESRPNSPLSSNGKVKIVGEENGEGGHFGEEIGGNGLMPVGSENSGEEERVNAAELEQYFAQPDNAEMLYAMFSRLLDRKMAELRMNRRGRMEAKAEAGDANANDANEDGDGGNEEDDIQDNYLDAFGVEKRRRRRKETEGNGTTGTDASQNAAILWPPSVGIVAADGQRGGWQQRRRRDSAGGDERRRMSLSPAIERQIGANASEEHANRRGMAAARRLFLAQKPSLPNPINGSSERSPNARGNGENEEWRQREWRRNVP